MSKQPYIPLYVGDYLKDTRVLPLSVRGAWVDLLLFMWDAPVRGEIIGTIQDFARMMSCERSEAEFALNLLKQKSTADFDLLSDGQIKITSRKMKRDAEISKKRSTAGKKGVEVKFADTFAEAKVKQNTDNDNEDDNDIELKLKESLDEIYLDQQKIKWPHLDFDFEYRTFCEKVRGSPDRYQGRDTSGIRLAFQSQLRYAKKKPNATTPTDKATAHIHGLMAGVQRRNGSKPEGG